MDTERRTVAAMIRIFCRGHHGGRGGLCPECRALLEYADRRLEKCPFLDHKPRCSRCTVHCYKPDMRTRIIEVMRYAGPRMLYRHPLLSGIHYVRRGKKTT